MECKKKGFSLSRPTSRRGPIRKKLQRYLCKNCQKHFTLELKGKRQRHTKDLVEAAIKRYIEDNASLQAVSGTGVSPRGLLNWVEKYGQNAKSPLEVAQQLKPRWSGVLGVDGKELKVKGRDFTLLIAQDLFTFDPVFFALAEGENIEAGRNFFLILREVIKYPIQGIISDLGRGRVFISLIEEIFPGVPHQACVVHFLRYANMTIPKSKKSPYYEDNLRLREVLADILLAPNFNDAEESFQRFLSQPGFFKTSYQKRVVNSLRRHFDLLTAHFHHPHLLRDNNITENLIKQLNRKLKASGGFKTLSSAYHFLKLWFIYYRFKPFANSNQTHRNGKAPLALAGVDIKNLDWLAFSQ